MGDLPKDEWVNKQASDQKCSNKDKFKIDEKRFIPACERSGQAVDRNKPTTREWVEYYTKSCVKTGVLEAGKMGLQQAIGLILMQLYEELFEEARDSYLNGFRRGIKDASFSEALKIRLMRVGNKVLAKYKDFIAAFKNGALSGFFSNLLTVLVNTIKTTSKRVVRIIREGFWSICRALKMSMFPPENISKAQAYDSAIKLLITGALTGVSIAIEEALNNLLNSILILAPIADGLTVAILGATTGIAASLIVYGIDKYDFFGIKSEEQHDFIMAEIEKRKEANLSELDCICDRIDALECPD